MFRNINRSLLCTFNNGFVQLAQPQFATHPHIVTNSDDLTPGITRQEYTERRRLFFESLPNNSLVIAPGFIRPVKTHDILWPFRQESNMWFLTGFEEPDGVAVFWKNKGKKNHFVMCVRENTAHSMIWDGERAGVEGCVKYFGADEAFPRIQLELFLQATLASSHGATIEHVFFHSGIHAEVDQIMERLRTQSGGTLSFQDPAPYFQSMRAIKSPSLQKMLQKSADITKHSFVAGMGCTKPGLGEHHIHAVMDFTAQLRGAQRLAYVPVIASGRNGVRLHYIDNNHVLEDGQLVMVDGGAEYHYYPTDCTRAWPVNGTFSPPQRKLYNAVLRVQEKLIEHVVEGQHIYAMQDISEYLLRENLVDIGVIPRNTSLETQKQITSRLYPHAWGHFMGIDIHEKIGAKGGSVFLPGMMHTVEPGVYIPCQCDGILSTIPLEFRGIGFRIEDNVIVGPKGQKPHVTTEGIPKKVEDIEHVMRSHELKNYVSAVAEF
eukprot:PhF_6_TR44438/c0_g1_i1/m.68403/K01262/pepP; Xaa-Pro aminopeptidase